MADNLLKYKYVIQNVAHAYGKTACFMPKPYYGDNGSGMHVNMSIWKGSKPVFAGDKYADLSDEALWFIGGLLKHAKTINAFTNPTTNSYKRLIPGFEAPVLLAYSARNRSASVRIPWTESPKAKRVECRFPDPAANPYLGFAALLMAGIDGIRNKIDPGSGLGQGPLRPAAGGAGGDPDGLRLLARGAGVPDQRPRVPAAWRRVHQGADRGLHRPEVAGGLHDGAHAASGRIPDVLLALSVSRSRACSLWPPTPGRSGNRCFAQALREVRPQRSASVVVKARAVARRGAGARA